MLASARIRRSLRLAGSAPATLTESMLGKDITGSGPTTLPDVNRTSRTRSVEVVAGTAHVSLN